MPKPRQSKPRAKAAASSVPGEIVKAALAGTPPPAATGFTDWPHAAAILQSMAGRLPAKDRLKNLSSIVAACLATPAPNLALNNFERLAASLPDIKQFSEFLSATPGSFEILSTIFGHSQFMSDVLIRQPEVFRWVVEEHKLKKGRSLPDYAREIAKFLKGCAGRDEQKVALCRLRRREMFRIAARDILRVASTEEVVREISDLASAIIEAAAATAREQMVARFGEPVADTSRLPFRPAGMCVIGMGKLGGRELNFSSDIDLIFIYDAEGQTSGKTPDGRKVPVQSNHVFFTRMGEEIVRFLGDYCEEGNLYRVDMRLRPEGAAGPLARSLESFLSYLREQARDWERLAYLKARIVSGPKMLADRIYNLVEDFVFSDVEPAQIVREVEDLKVTIDREVINSDRYHRDVKRGYGGIREIEFVVSAMQIIYGQTHRALHVRNTYVGIERLREVNLLSRPEAKFYIEAYDFLRQVEHRLQMAEEHQTHLLPEDPDELEIVARRCHFPNAAEFSRQYEDITNRIHQRFIEFFQQNPDAAGRDRRDLLLILDRSAPIEDARAALARHGFDAPEALDQLRTLEFGTSEIFISAEGQRSFEQLLPSLLRLARATPLPGRVLPHFHSFVMSIKGITYYYELIASHPDILKLLVTLFGTSGTLSEALIARPEYFDALISSRILPQPHDDEAQLGRIEAALGASRRLERKLVLLRRAARYEILLVALRYLLGLRDLPATLDNLTSTADNIVNVAFPLAAERAAERIGARTEDSDARALTCSLLATMRDRLAVIALGKFGGRELNFFSDLDVVFVFNDGPGAGDPEQYAVFADALSQVLSENLEGGKIFELDARLRPYGRNSPTATPLSLYKKYFKSGAEVWELQAFLRARHVAGTPSHLDELRRASSSRAASLDPAALTRQIREMRTRLADSVDPTSRRNYEMKRSPGGIVDVEFALQFLQLARALPAPPHAPLDYFKLLEAAPPLVPRFSVPLESMAAQYEFLVSVMTAIRLITGASHNELPGDPEARRAIALFLGLESETALGTAITKSMREIQRAWNTITKSTGPK
ncbi:MAG: bifunctional [glutamate--ammonia ligase]-adenylyl-L-tyrosine phosphorylase/[glutamate--ammonia-ligase] adenylyltransferase [Candidatus Sumerlaeaceae bacterium]|nr:bifunctional [glutamate--ammonia ligase]-adenylyl-L-tyrosine phosphorylase/[glutamate--ammonia-ligase] adenylyltransferase [Candidatus Sumerlaeaceae bacterium]